MRQLLPSTALLLLVSAGTQAANLTKAVVVLEPPYNRILTLDNVTLKCQGTYPLGDNSTQWLHNGTLISNQASYFIKAASVENSGEYRCRKGLSELSDPVQLEVHMGSAVPSTSPLLHWPQIPFSLVMVLLFAVDTGLYFAVQRDLHKSMRDWKNSKVSWKQGP
uniref:low affinity immunoglobulin gamma Fc region receptor III-like isoform X3 n=1 Tax=Odobenus rosmarus divergens TaxID=9708 RepID=UPI00063C2507|nr:PREDICTED: low affinity immunoglobulin gamma Fc region receptor III-like isoform X3 [Odobenus rosmarus divergens]